VTNSEDAWTAVAVALLLTLSVFDALLGGPGFDGILVVGPVIASATVSARRTLALAVLAVAACVVVSVLNDRLVELTQAVRIAGVAGVGAFCVLAATWRERRERDLQRVTRVAEVAQLAILRPIPPRVGPVAFASRYLSAAEQAFIGGDFYEVVATTSGVRIVIGDVRGKGLEAVHLAALVLGSFREAASVEQEFAAVAAAVDRAVAAEIALEDFVTAVFVEIRGGGEVLVVNCGHHPPLRITDRSALELTGDEASPPLGLNPSFTTQVHRLDVGDRLLLYTDGMVEARGPDRSFFELGPQALASLNKRSLESAIEGLIAAVQRHAGGHLDDDLALLLAELRD